MSIKKIDLNKCLTDLDGNEIKESNMGNMAWALKMHAGESLELDPSDVETLKNFIKDHDQLTILSKAQMLEVLA
jgi:mannose/fructose/N-acetylgalactosamine-specific phosphotransferase system component IIB